MAAPNMPIREAYETIMDMDPAIVGNRLIAYLEWLDRKGPLNSSLGVRDMRGVRKFLSELIADMEVGKPVR